MLSNTWKLYHKPILQQCMRMLCKYVFVFRTPRCILLRDSFSMLHNVRTHFINGREHGSVADQQSALLGYYGLEFQHFNQCFGMTCGVIDLCRNLLLITTSIKPSRRPSSIFRYKTCVRNIRATIDLIQYRCCWILTGTISATRFHVLQGFSLQRCKI